MGVVLGDQADDHVERLGLVVQFVLQDFGHVDVLRDARGLESFDHEKLQKKPA